MMVKPIMDVVEVTYLEENCSRMNHERSTTRSVVLSETNTLQASESTIADVAPERMMFTQLAQLLKGRGE